jgi:glucan phosphoethanolaminetransferase (alkaline phosphatase superfamily)
MNEAVFKTFWISNQVAFGRWNSPVAAMAHKAQSPVFLNPEQLSFGVSSFDVGNCRLYRRAG